MLKVADVLKKNGYRITPQRLAVYGALRSRTNHPCVDSVYNSLLPLFPTMSLATVYKSIELFKNLGLIQEINVGEGSFRYDANPNQHPHAICIKCGKVDDINISDFYRLNNTVEGESGYKIIKQQLYFYGYCPICKESNG